VDPVAAEVLALSERLPASNPFRQRHRRLPYPGCPMATAYDGLPAQG
jgi:hypothetical protein